MPDGDGRIPWQVGWFDRTAVTTAAMTWPPPAAQVTTGWQCPSCWRCYGPSVSQCMHCPATTVTANVTTTVTMHPCPSPREGGLCGCEEDGDT